MSQVKCAVCGESIDIRKAYWCPKHQFWLCYKHTEKGLLGISTPKCPQCYTVLTKG